MPGPAGLHQLSEQAGRNRGHAEKWVLISNEQCRGQEGESRVPLPRLSSYWPVLGTFPPFSYNQSHWLPGAGAMAP